MFSPGRKDALEKVIVRALKPCQYYSPNHDKTVVVALSTGLLFRLEFKTGANELAVRTVWLNEAPMPELKEMPDTR